ncbi:MAG: GMC family oxidoreductase [Sandaracinaceae bacterium]|nr:GMC family oxidoreductase [Sandaracinaceae bacterium]
MKKKLKSGHFRVGRRHFVRLTAAGAAGVYFTGCDNGGGNDAGTPGDDGGPMTDAGVDASAAVSRVRALVIGSGFGGSIAALRLAEADIPSTILERGRRWEITGDFDTFTTTQSPDARCAWMHNEPVLPGLPPTRLRGAPYTGLLQRIFGDNIDAVCAAAVGGGSLVYSGLMLQPPRAAFESVFPSELSYDEMDTVYYPRVLDIMRPGRLSDTALAHERYAGARIFIRDAMAAGLDVERVQCAFDFDLIDMELDGAFPQDQATLGDYLYGLNNGAKHSIDRVGYLTMAEATGMVDVKPLHQVTEVGEMPGGGYYANCELIDENGRVQSYARYEADILFMAAGSMNTTKLLLKAKRDGTLPSLNDQIGQGWGNNGQRILMRGGLTEETGAEQGGPACIFIHHHDNPEGVIGMEYGPAPIGFEHHCLVSATQGVPDTLGSLELTEAGEVKPVWDRNNDAAAGRAARHTLQTIIDATEGNFATLPGLDDPSITFHPLGGVTMGRATDTYGRVMGYSHLYVVDSALIPGSTPASNPFWTISAVAERCMDTIIAEDLAP